MTTSTTRDTDARHRSADIDQKKLYRHYRSVPDTEDYARMLELERNWIIPRVQEFESRAPHFATRGDLLKALRERHAAEEAEIGESESHRFLAEEATMEQFKKVVAEFAVDGLTESQSLLPIVPRLPYRSGMAVFRVLIDELGCGNEQQAHSQLYRDLLTELGMSTDLEHYVEEAGPESLAYVNLFYWLTSRAPAPDYFLGAYAYFEASVLYGFRGFARAAERLGIHKHAYYTEHLYIDSYHSQQMRIAIRAMDEEVGLDTAKVWAGVEITSAIVDEANEAAIARARGVTAP
ncbi:iron-containing redox enzyme family protein [Thermobifida halotolerans]|uniref:Iron-containing redox enzyme family protein n=1 Tax=Thermobifida halotolerans TaxID=483545 RepID=A0A399G095_9ACTN|nr:iron-containing redox enzyme family protein [Thermobifida halotolerans]UOE18565.1 iron-containing redox enzyme family protein [Thermobifida halotolerans]